jgi:hypothetical protein
MRRDGAQRHDIAAGERPWEQRRMYNRASLKISNDMFRASVGVYPMRIAQRTPGLYSTSAVRGTSVIL